MSCALLLLLLGESSYSGGVACNWLKARQILKWMVCLYCWVCHRQKKKRRRVQSCCWSNGNWFTAASGGESYYNTIWHHWNCRIMSSCTVHTRENKGSIPATSWFLRKVDWRHREDITRYRNKCLKASRLWPLKLGRSKCQLIDFAAVVIATAEEDEKVRHVTIFVALKKICNNA